MTRFNAFFMIHKGLRAMLYDVSMSLQQTDFASEAFPEALERLSHLIEIFDAHAGHEDKHMFCLLQSCDPALQAEMEAEHVTDIALSSELSALIDSYKTAGDVAARIKIGNRICYTFYEYLAFNLNHLNKEELVVNEALWSHYDDGAIIAANMRLVSALSPEEVRKNAVWMMRGCSNTDLAGWLSVAKKQVPGPVFDNLMNLAGVELPADRYQALLTAVMQTA